MPEPAEWDVDMTLITPHGTLLFNQEQAVDTTSGSGIYQLVPQQCAAATKPRVEKRDVPQGDGSIFQRRFETGYDIDLTIQYWTNGEPACGKDARCMNDLLGLHIRSLLNADGLYRLRYQPTGYFLADDITPEQRMFDQLRLRDWDPLTLSSSTTEIKFGLDSPFPYAIDHTQQLIPISDGGSQTITMVGNTDFYPVFKIQGPATDVTILNNTTDLLISWLGTLGGADYIEFDTFKNTAYLNGDDANELPGVGIVISDFFALVPGPNEIQVTGADVEFLVNNAWW